MGVKDYKWTEAEEKRLLELFELGATLEEIETQLAHTRKSKRAIIANLVNSGRIVLMGGRYHKVIQRPWIGK